MSIVRVGLSETERFAEGYDAIFRRKKSATATKTARKPARKSAGLKKKAPKKG